MTTDPELAINRVRSGLKMLSMLASTAQHLEPGDEAEHAHCAALAESYSEAITTYSVASIAESLDRIALCMENPFMVLGKETGGGE